MKIPESIVTRDQIASDLRSLGLLSGQVVMMHASVKSLGYVIGGPDTVLHALMDVLTPKGSLMMLAGWESSPNDAHY